MANGDPIPQLKDPKAYLAQYKGQQVAGRQPARAESNGKAAAKPAATGDGLLGQFMSRLDDIEDPFTRSLVQGAVEARISDRLGFRFHFPDPQEEALQKQETANEIMKRQIEGRVLSTQLAQAAILDLDDKDRASLRIEPGEDIFKTQPQRVPEITQALVDAGRLTYPVSIGDLNLAKLPTNELEATSMEEQRTAEGAEKLGRAAAGIGHAEKLAEAFAEAQADEGVIGEAMVQGQEETEAQTGVDVEADLDEDKGSFVFYDMTDRLIDDVAAKTGQEPRFVAEAGLSGSLGNQLRDQLEGLDTQNGELVVGKGDKGITDTATFYLTASLINMGAKAGLNDVDVMRRVKLPYNGVHLPSFYETGKKIAKDRGMEETVFFNGLGSGVMEWVARKSAELEAVQKASSR